MNGEDIDRDDARSIQESAAAWEWDLSRRALDELFLLARQYRSTEEYYELLRFISRFRHYAPFNAMLVHTQMDGARYVAPAGRWLRDYGKRVKPDAQPLVILQPMGPVMFVFDVSDTTPEPDAPPLPHDVEKPFEVRGRQLGGQLEQTIENARRDGVKVWTAKTGSQGAGKIGSVTSREVLQFPRRVQPTPEYVSVPHRYNLVFSQLHTHEERYATLVHELAHLYCGHLGTPDPRWWPNRRFLTIEHEEFEAESVSYLVCRRLGLETRSEQYLSGYMQHNAEVPEISLECVLKAAGLIEQMGRGRLKPRPEQNK